MESMTGYASQSFKIGHIDYESHLKSINGRFLEIRLNIPDHLISLEISIKKLIQSFFHRGTLDLIIKIRSQHNLLKTKPLINNTLFEFYLSYLLNHQINFQQKKYKNLLLTPQINLVDILNLPSVLSFSETILPPSHQEQKKLLQHLKQLCYQGLQSRKKEGNKLKITLTTYLKKLKTIVLKIKHYYKKQYTHPLPIKAYRKKLESIWNSDSLTSPEHQKDIQDKIDQTIISGWSYLWEKCLIDEELDRLLAHIEHIYHLFEDPHPIGKKMDFYIQELFRELNTIGSKSQNVLISQAVVEAKTYIEKIKEQVQNIQ